MISLTHVTGTGKMISGVALHPLLMQYREPQKVDFFDTPTDRREAAYTGFNASRLSFDLHVCMSISAGIGLSNPEGLQLARELIRPQLPHDLHDYVLEGVCKAVDGIHVLAVAPTGGGKTGYFYGYILLLKALEKMSPRAQLKRKFPRNPAIVIVFPTKGLEEEMVRQ